MRELIYILITAIMTYFFTSKTNKKDKKREIVVQYLIEAYRTLSDCCIREKLDPKIEKAISDIQLFGTKEEIYLAQDFINQLPSNHNATCDELLMELRNNLRKELNLETLKSNRTILHLRIK